MLCESRRLNLMNTGEGWDVGEEADENGCNKTI